MFGGTVSENDYSFGYEDLWIIFFGLSQNWAILIARRIRAKFWPDCAIPDTSMKFGTVVDDD